MALTLNNLAGGETGGVEEASGISGTPVAVSTPAARTGTYCIECQSGDDIEFLVATHVADAGSYHIVGFGFQTTSVGPSIEGNLFRLEDDANNEILVLTLEADGDMRVDYSEDATVTTVTDPFTVDIWHYIELVFQTLDSSNVTIYLDGSPIVTDTGIDMLSSPNVIEEVALRNSATGPTFYFDDFYWLTGAAGVSDRLGVGAEVKGGYNNTAEDATDQGDTLDAGSWGNTGEIPLNTSNEAEYATDPSAGHTRADEGSHSGPHTDQDGTLIGGIWTAHMKQGGGGATTHTVRHGVFISPSTDTYLSPTVTLTNSFANYSWLSEDTTYLPNASGEYALWGMETSGPKDIHCADWWYSFLQVGGVITQSVSGALTFSGAVTAIKIQFQTNTGTLTFAGSVFKKALKPLAGALTFVGNLAKKVLKPLLAGALTFSGDVFKKALILLTGVLTFSGDVTTIKKFTQAIAGVLTFSGDVFKKNFKALSGSLTFIGNVAKKALKPLSGTLTFSGIVATIKIQFQTNTGALTFSGDIVKKALKPLAGALTFAGDVVTLPKKLLTGVLTFAGSLTKKTLKPSLAGILNFSGDVFKKMFEALAGILTFVGDVDPVLLKKQAVAGVLTFSGDVITLPKKLLAGALTFSGDVVTLPKKLLSGALTFSGNLIKKTLKVLSGVLNFTGVVVASKIAFQAVAGALTFSGDVFKKALLTKTGALIFSGDVTTLPKKLLTGVLTFSGDVAKKAEVARAGVLTFSGNVFKKTLKVLSGVLTFSGTVVGDLNAVIQQAVSGVLTFAGDVTTVKIQFITLTGVLTFSGSLIKTIGKILSGILTPSSTVQKKTMKVVVGSLNFVGTVGAFEPIIATDTLQGTHITSVSIVGGHDITDTLEGEHDTTDTLEGNV